ncbi:hypothetical protein Daus18300_002805 [Diaporthe australafricana]|uniref:Heterokaryon incompatibility domain-containing protein n=1 Tax=Diaporthe australafricana TaxID=127596 RepID=A0ABR3XKR8_9PEZI
MPTRVIDVSSERNPRLVIAANKRGKFMALSYCWGPQGKDLLVLNDKTKSALLQGSVVESRFARTHREAFVVARALGIKYVWIDALCILQGNAEDWEAESKKMGQVYNNAYVTVLAGSSADSRAGFLADRSSPVKPFPMPLDDLSRDQPPFLFATMPRSQAEGPTRTRGWCFQEAMLSRRLITFGTEQLSFRCTTETCFEHTALEVLNGVPLTLESKETPVFHPDRQQLSDQPGGALATRHAVLEHWYVMLVEFTNRRLSNPHDIFACVSSLAQAAAPYLEGSRYLAGLWETSLVRGLLWRPSYYGAGEPTVLTRPQPSVLAPGPGPVVRAPSWSWAAVEGSIDHLDYEPNAGEPGITLRGPFPAIPGGGRVRNSVFDNKPGFVRVRPAARLSQAGQEGVEDVWSWSNDTRCKPDTLHMPACELRMCGRIARAVFSDQQVNVRKWRPRGDWRPPEQRPHGADTMHNGRKPVFERALGIYSYGFYLTGEQGKKFAVGLFDVKGETCQEVLCLQLTEVEGLMLREIKGSDGGRKFQRVGLFWLEEKHWFDELEEVEICLI